MVRFNGAKSWKKLELIGLKLDRWHAEEFFVKLPTRVEIRRL